MANLRRDIRKYRAKEKNNLSMKQSEEEDIVYDINNENKKV